MQFMKVELHKGDTEKDEPITSVHNDFSQFLKAETHQAKH